MTLGEPSQSGTLDGQSILMEGNENNVPEDLISDDTFMDSATNGDDIPIDKTLQTPIATASLGGKSIYYLQNFYNCEFYGAML